VDTVVIAAKFLPELRRLPDDILSFPVAVYESMEAKYTGLLTDEPLMAHSVKADLTPALARLNPTICAEVDEALKEELPPCEDWAGIHIYMSLVKVVAKVSGRVFVGPEICHNPEYLDASINYTMELAGAHEAIKPMRPWLRPFLAERLPQVQALRKRERQAQDFLSPVVEARLEAQKNPDHKKPDDMLQWLLNRNEERKLSRTRLARLMLAITFAAIHTTSLTVTNV
jgi:cytochrome P450